MWVEFVVGFSLGTPASPFSLQKLIFFKFQFDPQGYKFVTCSKLLSVTLVKNKVDLFIVRFHSPVSNARSVGSFLLNCRIFLNFYFPCDVKTSIN